MEFLISFSNSWYVDREDIVNQKEKRRSGCNREYPFAHFECGGDEIVSIWDYKLDIETINEMRKDKKFYKEALFIDEENNHSFRGTFIEALLYILNQKGRKWD